MNNSKEHFRGRPDGDSDINDEIWSEQSWEAHPETFLERATNSKFQLIHEPPFEGNPLLDKEHLHATD